MDFRLILFLVLVAMALLIGLAGFLIRVLFLVLNLIPVNSLPVVGFVALLVVAIVATLVFLRLRHQSK